MLVWGTGSSRLTVAPRAEQTRLLEGIMHSSPTMHALHRAPSRGRRMGRCAACISLVALASTCFVPSVSGAARSAPTLLVREAREVRTTWTRDLGVPHPEGVTYVPTRGELLVGDERAAGRTVTRLDFDESARGSLRLPPQTETSTLAFDPATNELTAIAGADLVTVAAPEITSPAPRARRTRIGDLALRSVRGSTFDPRTGTWFVLDARGRSIVRVAHREAPERAATRIPLRDVGPARLLGVAFNPSDGLIYVGAPDQRLVHAVDTEGVTRKLYSLASARLRNPAAMTFAPSTDTTDAAGTQNLFVAHSGDAQRSGGLTELTLAAAPVPAAVPTVTATHVQTIATSAFNPGSPDPSGIAYMAASDRLQIADSEVEEQTGAGWHNVNLWQLTRSGTVTDTGSTFSYSKEPTGMGFDPATNTLFISDDNNRRIYVVRPGPDGRFGTTDDVRTAVNTGALGSSDTEDPAFDTASGHLFFSDAVQAEIYRVDPVNGIFGDGNDVVTHFDVGQYGPTDTEGLAYNAATDTLFVGDRTSRKIYEVTKNGSLVRIIDAKVGGYTVLSGLTVAPAIDNPARRDIWIVSRGVDNGPNPNENDGKIIEVSIPGSAPVDTPPTVSITAPAHGGSATGANVSIQASASDDNGVTRVEFFDGTNSLGTDTNGADGWSITWNTTTTADGRHSLRATATDTIDQTGTDVNDVTVDNSPPTVAITSPTAGATVSGTTTVVASAADAQGLASVAFLLDGSMIGSDTNGTDGWSVAWSTATAPSGQHLLTARATSSGGLATTSAGVPVAVSNSASAVLDIPVRTGRDDVEQRASNGFMDATSSDLEMMLDGSVLQRAIGLRFTDVAVPNGASIVNVHVQFRVDEVTSNPTNLVVNALATDNATPFSNVAFSLSSAPRTNAGASWAVVPWTTAGQRGVDQRSPNLAAVLQEIVDRPGWQAGNALALVVTGSGRRVARSFERGAASAAVLHIEYASG
jgi:hypothetical protein